MTYEDFWLSDAQGHIVSKHFPEKSLNNTDVRSVMSGILHVLLSNYAWKDCPKRYGRSGTISQAFRNWRHRPFWTEMLLALAEEGWIEEAHALDPLAMTLSRPARHGKKIDERWRRTNRTKLSDRTMYILDK
ncbi:transposase [Methylobacterium sp. W2]|uniref:transposase n=1 Tax=Methylobacterium sp. W2 TaxID=2598107 RepID=UPI001D0C1D37|nr:transposase [Methylobacterium sp. W2]